ncbi:MAG TPA: hypothetical protein VIL20_02830 [Sandaracinaceae bacterium]
MRRSRAAVLLVVLAVSASASAQERVQGELRVGGAYDGNPSLAADPGNRRVPSVAMGRGRPGPSPEEDGAVRVGGWLAGRIGSSPSASARFELDGRVFGRGALLFFERLVIEGSLRVDDLVPYCQLEGTRLDVTLSDDSAWGGAAQCGAMLKLPYELWLSAAAEGGVRAFDAGQLDVLAGGEMTAGASFDALAIELGLSVLRRESDVEVARRTELAPWIELRVSTPYVGGRVAYRYVHRFFDANSRTGGEHVGRLELTGMPLSWLGAYVELELGHAEGGPQALAYDRVQVGGGLRLVVDWRAPVESPAPPEVQGPATIEEDGWVRFEVALAGAERVSVVGGWNAWDAARGALERRGDRFVGRFRVGSGRHEYALIVDGEPMRPPGAPRYVSDGFGGENAVLIVP